LGRLAQLVERLPYTQNVGGSNPSAPTRDLPYSSLYPGIPNLLALCPSKLMRFLFITSEPIHV